jgi:Arc/MetJ family transcription regulator
MKQMNLNLTAAFERDLARYMRRRGLKQKSEAVRVAVREALERLEAEGQATDFRVWLGFGLRAEERAPRRFASEDDLWSSTPRS